MTEHLDPELVDWVAKLLDTTIDHAVIFIDPAGRIVRWKGGSQRLFGYSESEAVGLPFATLFTAEDLARGLDAQEIALARSARRAEGDRWQVRSDQSRFWASGVLQAIHADDGELVAFCKTVRDRTDLRIRWVSLQNQLSCRLRKSKEKDDALKSIAHDLRNPMMPIFTAIALLKSPVDDRLRTRSLDIIERQFGILKTLIDDINEQMRPWQAAVPVHAAPQVVQEALCLAADGLAALAAERGHTVELVQAAIPIRIRADGARLQRVLHDLIGNAFKYTPRGGHINLSTTVEADMAVIRVEDDGIGIGPSVLPRIFDLFTREERNEITPGNGDGLAVVKDLVRSLGGSVDVRSPGLGQGSVFALRLPLMST